MGRLHRLPLRLRRLLNRALVLTKGLPPSSADASPAELLFAARVKIGMSQTEAAARAGMTQQTWQALESGGRDAGVATWRRAFAGLECDLVVLPRPRRDLGEWHARRALKGLWSARSVRRIPEEY